MEEERKSILQFEALDPGLSNCLQFILEAGRLKEILRQTQLIHPPRRENTAEHSWHLILMAMTLKPYANEAINLEKVICMLALHDLGEIEKGDVFYYDKNPEMSERPFVESFFSRLDTPARENFMALWDEFEVGVTPEAKFARALDRFQPFLDNLANGGESWLRNKIPLKKALEKNAHIEEGSRILWETYKILAYEADSEGLFFKLE